MDLKRLTGQNWKTPFGAVAQPPADRKPTRAPPQQEVVPEVDAVSLDALKDPVEQMRRIGFALNSHLKKDTGKDSGIYKIIQIDAESGIVMKVSPPTSNPLKQTCTLETLKMLFSPTSFSQKKEAFAESDPPKSLEWAVEAYKGLITLALRRKWAEYASKKPAGDINVFSSPKAVYAKSAFKANDLVLVPATRQVLARKVDESCPANAIDLGPRLGKRWADQGPGASPQKPEERAFALYGVKKHGNVFGAFLVDRTRDRE